MSLFGRKDEGKRNVNLFGSHSYDPYNRFRNTNKGIFGFRKDRHVIMPGVTSYEEMRLKKIKDHVEKETGKKCTLSQDLINDIYSIYVNGNVKRRPEDNLNEIRHQILDSVYDSLTKVVTVDSPLYTQMLTRELALALQKVDDNIRDEQMQQGKGGGGGDTNEDFGLGSKHMSAKGDEDGDGDSNDSLDNSGKEAGTGTGMDREPLKDIIDKALKNAEKDIEKAKKNTDEKIKDLKKQLGEEALKDLVNNDPDFLENIEALKSKLKAVTINKDSIRKVLEKILNESMNYFSAKFSRVEESLFDCEECEDLFGLEFLNPAFKNVGILEMGNEHRQYKGKIDLYLDCSGSMDSHETFEGESIRMIDLAKGIAMVLYRMGMIDNLYFFDTSLYEIKNVNEISILGFSNSGGTDFNTVMRQIKENGNNSVIITDGFDGCHIHDNKAFWIGIGGTTFSRNDEFKTFRANNQCVAYDSYTSKFNYCK